MSDHPQRIAVTGASGYIGGKLVRRLEREHRIERILAVDVRPLPYAHSDKVVFLEQNVATPSTEAFRSNGIEVVVHLAFILKPSRDRAAVRYANVVGTESVLVGCAEAEVGRMVYLSSTSVYGAHADNPVMLSEDDQPRPIQRFEYSQDKLAAESLIKVFTQLKEGFQSTILRACPVVGPGADNFIARAFLKRFLVAVRGTDPPMQLLHEDDVTEVLACCTLNDIPGLYNVASDGEVRWSEMAAALGRKVVRLPAPLLYAATEAAWAMRLQSDSPSNGLDFIRYRWTASAEKFIRATGLELKYSSSEAWEQFAQGHRAQAAR